MMTRPSDSHTTGNIRANADRLDDQLLVGGALSPAEMVARAQLDDLRAKGVTDILDCRIEWSDEDLVADHAPSMRYHHLGVDDDGGRQPLEWWRTGLEIAHQVLAEPDASLLVHCHMGVNRGPSMAFAVLVDVLDMEPVEAYRLIRTRRPQAYAIYAVDGLRAIRTLGNRSIRSADIPALREHMAQDHTDADIIATIGRIRRAEAR